MRKLICFAAMAAVVGQANAQYMIDDGSMENAIGLNGTSIFDQFWSNSFVAEAGCEVITSIDIMLGFGNGNISNGRPITMFIGADSNLDGILDQGGVLSSMVSTVQGANTQTFATYDLTDVTLNAGDGFVVGALWTNTATERFISSIDTTDPDLSGRSYIGFAGGGTVDLNNINGVPGGQRGFIEQFGLPGNWMIRANCEAVPEPGTIAALGLGALCLLRRRSKK